MASIKNVIQIGGGGNIGAPILAALDAEPALKVSVLSRAESTATFPSHITIHKTDYSQDSLIAAFKGQDAIVSTTSGTSISQQKDVIDAAIKAGVKWFIPSEFGSNTQNKKAVESVPFLRTKVEVIEYLQSKEKEISWTAVATGPFFDWGLQVGFLGFDLKTHTATIFDDGNVNFSTSNLSTIGKATASVLLHTKELKNKFAFIQSFSVSQNVILAALEKATGKKWTINHTTAAETAKVGGEKLSKGDLSGIYPLLQAAIFTDGNGGNFEVDETLSNDVLGLPKEDLEEVVTKVVKGEKV